MTSRVRLLPFSGIGIAAPWLLIAPLGKPIVRLDLRILDRVALADLEPSAVLLACGEYEVVLDVADGARAARWVVQAAAPYTREIVAVGESVDPAPAAPWPQLLCLLPPSLEGRRFELTRPATHIGRTNDNDIILVHRSVSRRHATITRDPGTGRFTVHDRDATNSVHVNGEPTRKRVLAHGDYVDFGHVRTRFTLPLEIDVDGDAPKPDRRYVLAIGQHIVSRNEDRIEIGARQVRIDRVEQLALHGKNLRLPDGNWLEAAMAMFVVAAEVFDRG